MQHLYMPPLYFYIFVQLYFRSLLRSRHAINFDENTFYFNFTTTFTTLITFPFSYHYYVHYAVIKTKNIIFLVNIKINFATTFTAPGSWKITYFYFTTTTTTFTTAWFWPKNILFDFHHFYFSTTSTSSTTFTMSWSR